MTQEVDSEVKLAEEEKPFPDASPDIRRQVGQGLIQELMEEIRTSDQFEFFNESIYYLARNYSARFAMHAADFTRNRKLPLPDLLSLLFVNNGQVLHSQLTRLIQYKDTWKVLGSSDINDVNEWRETMKKIGNDKTGKAAAEKCAKDNISRTAVCNQRKKLNPDGMAWQNRLSTAAMCRKFENKMHKFHGYLQLGVDGSDIYAPQSEEAREALGNAKNGLPDDSNPVMGKLSGLYDLLNQIYLDMQIGECKHSEQDFALEHLKVLDEFYPEIKTLIDYDRGYFSLRLLYQMHIDPYRSFIFRLSEAHLTKYQDQVPAGDERVFTVKLTTADTNQYRCEKALRNKLLSTEFTIRIAKPIIGVNEDGSPKYIVIATDVLPEEISLEELADAYWSRWQIMPKSALSALC